MASQKNPSAIRKGSGGQGKSRTARSPRRQPARKSTRAVLRLQTAWTQLLELTPVWLGLFLVGVAWCLLPLGHAFRAEPADSIASRTYIANRDLSILNESATLEARDRARQAVLPVYDFDHSLETNRLQQLRDLFATGRTTLMRRAVEEPDSSGEAAPEPDSVEAGEEAAGAELLARQLRAIYQESGLELQPEAAQVFEEEGFSRYLEDLLGGALERILQKGIVGNKDVLLGNQRGITIRDLRTGERRRQLELYNCRQYPDQVEEAIAEELRGAMGFSTVQRDHLGKFLLDNVTVNLTPNSQETQTLRDQAAADVRPVYYQIREGEVVIRQGEKIDAVAAAALSEMAGTRDTRWQRLSTILGTLLFLGIGILILWFGAQQGRRMDRSRQRLLNECLFLLLLHVLGVKLAYFMAEAIGAAVQRAPWNAAESYFYAIPFGSLALTAVLLYGRGVAQILLLVFSLIAGRMAGGDSQWALTVFSLTTSLAAIYVFDQYHFRQRSMTARAGLVVGVVGAATVLMLQALNGEVAGAGPLGVSLACAFFGGLAAAAVTSFTIPILEGLLGITTRIKLIELANPNLPLMRRLALEAPGTFQHSLAVANLAKSGCDAIDADAVLANTGALYHDIGKLLRPHYFVENQIPGRNPHDKIQPTMSALILINHVKEGLDIAREHHLPLPILDAIEQHHGTRLIKFFYSRAKELREETEEIREEEFRYPGPKPQSKAMGVLMLADAVEAASRTLVEPSRQKIRTLVRTLFDDCLQDGQLDETDLTLGDLRKVEDAFKRILYNIYHRRIDYPGFDFNRQGGPKKRQNGDTKVETERRKVS